MSSGGSGFVPSQSNSTVATNTAPTTSQNVSAPSGGKGGYNSPMTMQDFAEQQPQVYMPPAQPSFYDQAFTNSYYNPSFSRPRMDYGLGGLGNAYARRSQYSPPSPFNGLRMSPIEAQPPMDEMRMGVMGGGFQQSRSFGPYTGGFGNSVASPPSGGFGNNVPEPMPGSDREFISYPGGSGLGGLMSGAPGQKPDPLKQFDPRINLSPNAFGSPPEPVSGWMNTPAGRLWSA